MRTSSYITGLIYALRRHMGIEHNLLDSIVVLNAASNEMRDLKSARTAPAGQQQGPTLRETLYHNPDIIPGDNPFKKVTYIVLAYDPKNKLFNCLMDYKLMYDFCYDTFLDGLTLSEHEYVMKLGKYMNGEIPIITNRHPHGIKPELYQKTLDAVNDVMGNDFWYRMSGEINNLAYKYGEGLHLRNDFFWED